LLNKQNINRQTCIHKSSSGTCSQNSRRKPAKAAHHFSPSRQEESDCPFWATLCIMGVAFPVYDSPELVGTPWGYFCKKCGGGKPFVFQARDFKSNES